MSGEKRRALRVALVCGADGAVREILRDEVGVRGWVAVGERFVDVVHRDSAAKAQNFLAALAAAGAVSGWDLNVDARGDEAAAVRLYFSGDAAPARDQFLVLGARSRSEVDALREELRREAGANAAAWGAAPSLSQHGAERDEAFYEELSRLNNELATAQRELAKKNAELARLNEQKNRFLGIAAHDLRNPLQVILAYSKFLREDAEAAGLVESAGLARTVSRSSAFMLDLVENLLDVSKIEAGRLDLEREPADLNAVVEANVALNRVLAERKTVAIALEPSPEPVVTSVDVPKIEQVLNNLIGNAVKFSPPGATVRVRVGRDAGGGGEPCAVVSVVDEGQGVAPEDLERIFRPFETRGRKGTAGEKGTGLGLAIVQRIVAGHGGEIRVESEPGRGAAFHVYIPLGAAGPSPRANPQEVEASSR